MGNITGIIRNVIGVLVVMACIAVTWPVQMIAVDGFYKKFVNHCESNGIEYTRLYARADSSNDLDLSKYIQFNFLATSLTDASCGNAATAVDDTPATTIVTLVGSPTWAVPTKLYSEHNELVQGATLTGAAVGTANSSLTVANGKYKAPMAILKPYSSISTVILGAIPVLSSVAFIGAAGLNLYQSRNDSGMVSGQVLYTIGALIAVIVVLFGMPILLGFFNIAYVASGGANISGGGPWEATRQFGNIISIVFEMSPILAILSSMTGFAYIGIKNYGSQAVNMIRG